MADSLDRLFAAVQEARDFSPGSSRTAKLFRDGVQKMAKKLVEESIEVAGVPLVVWAARLSLFLLIQGIVVLGSYAYYGFGTDPSHFGPGFGLYPIHAAVNLDVERLVYVSSSMVF